MPFYQLAVKFPEFINLPSHRALWSSTAIHYSDSLFCYTNKTANHYQISPHNSILSSSICKLVQTLTIKNVTQHDASQSHMCRMMLLHMLNTEQVKLFVTEANFLVPINNLHLVWSTAGGLGPSFKDKPNSHFSFVKPNVTRREVAGYILLSGVKAHFELKTFQG